METESNQSVRHVHVNQMKLCVLSDNIPLQDQMANKDQKNVAEPHADITDSTDNPKSDAEKPTAEEATEDNRKESRSFKRC